MTVRHSSPLRDRQAPPEGAGQAERQTVGEDVVLAIRTVAARTSFVSCGADPDQLYDLDQDTNELVNLADRSTHEDLRGAFRDELAARWDVGALEQRVLESQRERHLVAQALATGRRTSWDYQPRVDAATQYVRSGADMYELQRRARLDSGDPPSRA